MTEIEADAFVASNIKFADFSPLVNIKKLNKNVFSLTLIEKIKIPSSVVEIEERCFHECSKLKFVEFPPDSCLETIGISAFSRCKLNCVSIPSKTTKISDSAFEKCIKLIAIEILGEDHSITINKNSFTNVSEKFSIFAHKTIRINFVDNYIKLSH